MLAAGYAWWLPPDASEHGESIDSLIVIVHWFMALLFVGWGAFFLYCLFRFRQRAGHQPTAKLPKAKASKISEILVIVVEAVLLLGFSIPIWGRVRGSGHVPKPEDAMVIRVVAEQFQWNVHYAGKDGVFGRTDAALMSKENPLGLDREDPEAKDDIVKNNQMHIPVNRDILVHLSSKDVIHSFGVPILRVKQDVIPGISQPVWFKATKTTDDIRLEMVDTYRTNPKIAHLLIDHVAMAEYKGSDGSVLLAKGDLINEEMLTTLSSAGVEQIEAAPRVPTQIACAQLCGLNHFRMRGFLHIDSETQFAEWVAEEEELLAEEEDEGY